VSFVLFWEQRSAGRSKRPKEHSEDVFLSSLKAEHVLRKIHNCTSAHLAEKFKNDLFRNFLISTRQKF